MNTTGVDNDELGSEVDISGDWAIAGGGNRADYSGEAVIFRRTDTGWEKFQHLLPDTDEGQRFGRAVAIDGEYAIVGAFRDDAVAEDAGAAYVYHWDGNSWIQERQLLPANDNGEEDREFGYSVDIQVNTDNPGGGQDVVYAVVGEWKNDFDAVDQGSVYIFKKENNEWTRVEKLYGGYDNSIFDDMQFGKSVAIDGDYLVVSTDKLDYSYYNWTLYGYIQIFKRIEDNNWELEATFAESAVNDNDWYGSHVDISGTRVIVSCSGRDMDISGSNKGRAYLYKKDDNEWKSDGLSGSL